MKILVIPDVHTYHKKLEKIINKYNKTHKLVFIGDYFDQFNDTPEINQDTAHWLKNTMNEYPDWVYLFGNHDINYHPHFSSMCSGYSRDKKIVINKELSISDWDKLKYFHFENGHWFSHAGLTKYWFQHPMQDAISPDNVQRIINDAVIKLKAKNENNAISAAGFSRGGNNPVGGLLWQDWRDLDFISNLHQVVGHSPINNIKIFFNDDKTSSITNVDTSIKVQDFKELLEIDELGNKKILVSS